MPIGNAMLSITGRDKLTVFQWWFRQDSPEKMGWEASLEKWLRCNPAQRVREERGRHVFKESPAVQSTQRCGREESLVACSQCP